MFSRSNVITTTFFGNTIRAKSQLSMTFGLFLMFLQMATISYHCAHEQFSPSDLLEYAKAAEKAGFHACHCSDHFHPWSLRQGQSGFSFSWLGAALEATSFPFSMVNAPGQRYHPAIVAQAIGTLTQMYPGRLEVAFGSGEAINEKITGDPWPKKSIRNQRLLECVHIIRKLLKGKTVSHHGFVKIQDATLFTRPSILPKLLGAAITEQTARWVGSWADGLLTTYQSREEMQKRIIAFKEGGGEGKPLHVQMAFSYARDEQDALDGAYDQWRSNLAGLEALENFSRPEQFDEKTKHLRYEDVKNNLLVSSDPEIYKERIEECLQLGFSNVILHNVNHHQLEFIEDFGKKVIPFINDKTETEIMGGEVII
jgi:coenzyme F420-dependent glucose-6-phosphate dehydrogenase